MHYVYAPVTDQQTPILAPMNPASGFGLYRVQHVSEVSHLGGSPLSGGVIDALSAISFADMLFPG